jgi:hypothetical protein
VPGLGYHRVVIQGGIVCKLAASQEIMGSGMGIDIPTGAGVVVFLVCGIVFGMGESYSVGAVGLVVRSVGGRLSGQARRVCSGIGGGRVASER